MNFVRPVAKHDPCASCVPSCYISWPVRIGYCLGFAVARVGKDKRRLGSGESPLYPSCLDLGPLARWKDSESQGQGYGGWGGLAVTVITFLCDGMAFLPGRRIRGCRRNRAGFSPLREDSNADWGVA